MDDKVKVVQRSDQSSYAAEGIRGIYHELVKNVCFLKCANWQQTANFSKAMCVCVLLYVGERYANELQSMQWKLD